MVEAQTELLAAARRYQLQPQEEAKEWRHSHSIGGPPESDDQPELPSPPALSMSLSAKGQLTTIGQCPQSPPCRGAGRAAGPWVSPHTWFAPWRPAHGSRIHRETHG